MRYAIGFTDGVVKSRQTTLLGEKLFRLAEGSAEEAFKAIKESGFGQGSGAETPFETDLLVRSEEEALNAFIREYSPSENVERFLLADYDFHNAEGVVKAEFAGADEGRLLLPEGAFSVADMRRQAGGEDTALPVEMKGAIAASREMFASGEADGFKIDALFKRALFVYLKRVAKVKVLKEILAWRADFANTSATLRSQSREEAEKMLVEGGKCPISRIIGLLDTPREKVLQGDYPAAVKLAFKELAVAEREAEGLPLALLYPTRYDMKGEEPFIAYVYQKRADIANVRILLACLSAGLSPAAARSRLRVTWR